MLNASEIHLGVSTDLKSPPVYLYPWVLVGFVSIKNIGSPSVQIPFEIPEVRLNDFSHPNEIPGKDCPFAIDGERYYFTKQVHRDASGKRSKRRTGEQGAYWKSTSTDIDITDLNGKLIGYMRKYTLYEDKDCKRSANWYMEEYRAHDPPELVDPYILCKIYDKESCCPKFTDTSIRTLRKRLFERQLGSHPDQTNSQFDNMNQSQTQFDDSNFPKDLKQLTLPPLENIPPESILPNPGPSSYSNEHAGFSNLLSMSHEDVIIQPTLPKKNQKNFASCSSKKKNKTTLPTSENFPPESILPTSGPPSDIMVFPMPHGLSNEFSMSRDPSGNLNPPESIRPIPRPPDYSNGFSTSHDASGNQNRPESIPSIPWNSIPMNQSQTLSDNNNFFEDPIMQPTESFPSYSIPLTIPRPTGYNNGFSTSHDASGNQNRPESIPSIPWNSNPMNQSQTQPDNNNFVEDPIMQPTESFPSYSIPLTIPRPTGYNNGFSTSHDASGNQNRPEPIPSIPWNSNPMNQSQTQPDNNNFVEDHTMQSTFPTPENFLSDSICPTSLWDSLHEYPCMMDGNLNAVDGEESSLDCFSQF